MASIPLARVGGAGTGALLLACVAEQGSAAHPWFAAERLISGPESARNLADAVHFLCALHGRQPGVVDLAAGRSVEPAARAWLAAASDAMAAERQYLTRLAVAAGPVPSTPGGATSDTAVIAQRGAIATLAQSDRRGCALGAAVAFSIDWHPIRALLDSAAERLGVQAPACRLGSKESLSALADAVGAAAQVERALLFGAQQLALQHRGLWDLLEARHQARSAA